MAQPPEPVSVLISSRDRPQLLVDTVNSILAGDVLPAELVVVDQSGERNDELAALGTVGGTVVRYAHERSVGLSTASNHAVELATHPELVFTHDDVRVAPTWLARLIEALRRAGPRTVVTGRILPEPDGPEGGFVPTLNEAPVAVTYSGRPGINVLYTLNMALHRRALEEVGPFDERLGPGTPFPGGEDSDLGLRLLEAGYAIEHVPEAVLYHRAWRPNAERLRTRWAYGRGQGAFYAKHRGLSEHYVLRRASKEVADRLRIAAREARRAPRVSFDNGLSVLAIASGAGEWMWRERRSSASRSRERASGD